MKEIDTGYAVVYIEFGRRRLQRCYHEQRVAEATWGRQVARRYVAAIGLLKAAHRPSDLRKFRALNYHQLKADRKGEHVLELGARERLIFTVREGDKALIARIEEVSTTHYDR